jgi:hypothetical protein
MKMTQTQQMTSEQRIAIERDYNLTALPDNHSSIERYNVSVTAPEDEDDDSPLDEIRAIMGPAWRVEWAGSSNTNADGITTEDIYVELISATA